MFLNSYFLFIFYVKAELSFAETQRARGGLDEVRKAAVDKGKRSIQDIINHTMDAKKVSAVFDLCSTHRTHHH